MINAFLHPALLGMGLHVAGVRVRRAVFGHVRHEGPAEEILRAGLERCWSGEYLTASPGHYRQLWTRDQGFAAPALVRLGGPWPERLLSSLAWAMEVWTRRRSHVSTTINPLLRAPVDIFDYGIDSLPLLLSSLRALERGGGAAGAGAAALAHEHRDWLAAEVEHFVEVAVDAETGLVRSDRHFSAHRDTFKNGSTAYANTMVALLGRIVAETGWGPALLSRHFGAGTDARAGANAGAGASAGAAAPEWGSLVRRHFWTGDRFRDRLGTDETSGEANVWPFFAGLIEDGEMQAAALETLQREGYAAPYPLRFQASHGSDGLMLLYRLWSADYQTTTSWTSLGSIYLSLLTEVDPPAAAAELERMRRLIERDGTFWEVLDGRGRPWRSRSGLSVSDVSMLWGAIILETLQRPAGGPPLRIAS
ncbi:MAG TPA: hypothetical protein VMQ65_06330 [Candidatus Limnocylindria bacterium]|nr:hypothetical protein [Candidatus Limnocylindria bacterium]